MNRPAEVTNPEPPLEIRFGPVDIAQVRIRSTDPGIIVDELTGRVATAPKFFERTAVCLDLSELGREPDAAELRGFEYQEQERADKFLQDVEAQRQQETLSRYFSERAKDDDGRHY